SPPGTPQAAAAARSTRACCFSRSTGQAHVAFSASGIDHRSTVLGSNARTNRAIPQRDDHDPSSSSTGNRPLDDQCAIGATYDPGSETTPTLGIAGQVWRRYSTRTPSFTGGGSWSKAWCLACASFAGLGPSG